MEETLQKAARTVLALDATNLKETWIIRAVRDGQGTPVGVLVGSVGDDDVTDAANQLSMQLHITPPGHWRLTGEMGRPDFYLATRPHIHDWPDFLHTLGVRLDDDEAWQAITDIDI